MASSCSSASLSQPIPDSISRSVPLMLYLKAFTPWHDASSNTVIIILTFIVNPVKIPDMIYLVNIYSRWHWFSGILYIQQRQDFARIPLSFAIVPKELIQMVKQRLTCTGGP